MKKESQYLNSKIVNNTAKRLEQSEGYRRHVYLDSEGIETIGIGFNLEVGFSLEECRLVLKYRIKQLMVALSGKIPFYNDLPESIQSVLIDMAYNLGLYGLLSFKNTLKALEDRDYDKASIEMLDSKWAKQVGNRAVKLSEIVKGESNV